MFRKNLERKFYERENIAPPSVDALGEVADAEDGYEEEAAFSYAPKEELPLSFEYKIPQTLDIESKDKETILPLFNKKLQGSFFYCAVPRLSNLTFLVCKASADKELLSGLLNVYFGGRFIGNTFLSEKKACEEFYVNLGADREVKVRREKIKDKIKETFLERLKEIQSSKKWLLR